MRTTGFYSLNFFLMKYICFLLSGLLATASVTAQSPRPIYSSKAYTVYPDRVVEGKYTARALSATELTSNYRSPANMYKSAVIEFKFSINGKDNEMVPGVNHHFVTTGKATQTQVIVFGQPDAPQKSLPGSHYLQPSTRLTIRLDMRPVLNAFKEKGYYTCFNGDKIYKNDFKGVFVAGSTAPLIWDFNNLVNHPALELKDPDEDGIYETTLVLNKPEDENGIASSWKLTRDVSAFPQYHSSYKISDALYNLALQEMQNAVEPDSTFRTGKEWGGVWTRDISYSIILSMAVLQPKVAVYSLLRKVKNGRIIQDTGTGGAYPCSSDRMIWAVAAWEVYKVTGDRVWLDKAYQIISKSAEDDVSNVYDKETGLVRGESSFLDWREETYPRWMQPADIYESECLGTNALHYQVNKVLAAMAQRLGEPQAARTYEQRAAVIKQGIQKYLWMPGKGYYGQYLYGRNFKTLSPRSEALGEALSVLFDAAGEDKCQRIISNTPVNAFGIPCIYSQIPDILPYHNNAVWPFVETYWALASAKAGNEASVISAISAVYRPAALFLTNKENFVVADGDFAGTQINSSNMLWSLSGNIALVYRVLFGIHYKENSLQFAPFVPKALAGDRSLSHFKYRNAWLDIDMKGFGNRIKTITLDGRILPHAIIPESLTGQHHVNIVLADNRITGKIDLVPDYTAPETPVAKYENSKLSWLPIAGARSYQVIRNGQPFTTTRATMLTVPVKAYAEYQVASVDAHGVSSFNSEPVAVVPAITIEKVEAEDVGSKAEQPYKGFSGSGFVELGRSVNTEITFTINVTQDGLYALDFRYANGNGPINTENKCAIRTLDVDKQFAGTVVFPQRGKGEWSEWGFSNAVKMKLSRGRHSVTLAFKPANENMNGDINQAMIDYLRIIELN
jgi:hypothetical protein